MPNDGVGGGDPSDWRFDPALGIRDVPTFEASVDGRPASRLDFFQALSSSVSCRRALARCLLGSPAGQIFWETPPLSTSTTGNRFEFVAVPTRLSREPDDTSFRQFFERDELAATFPNLRGDALLVSPANRHAETRYNYLMSFLRTGTDAQVDAVWAAVGRAALSRLGDEPLWVSTSGGGVPWLHFRIDSSPKYYTHAPYRDRGGATRRS